MHNFMEVSRTGVAFRVIVFLGTSLTRVACICLYVKDQTAHFGIGSCDALGAYELFGLNDDE